MHNRSLVPEVASARTSLFRPEVESSLSGRAYGSVTIISPVRQTVWAITAAVFIVGTVLWLSLGSYTRRIRLTGLLVPRGGVATIQATTAGVTQTLRVKEGDHVKAGEPLLTISTDHSSGVNGRVLQDVLKKLGNEKSSIQQASISARAAAVVQEDDLRRQVDSVKVQLEHSRREIRIDRQQEAGELSIINKLQPLLNKGFISPMQFHQEETNLLDARASIERASAQEASLTQQLGGLTAQLKQIPFTTSDKVRDNQRSLVQLDEAIDRTELESEIVIRAPQDGTVSSLLVHPSEPVQAQQSLLSIIPAKDDLQAELLVPNSSMSMIRSGLDVAIRFPSFPFQKVGVFKGKVSSVSTSALDTSQVARLSGRIATAQSEPSYRVLVRIPVQSVNFYGEDHPLSAGTQVDADILLENRRIYEWMFEPIYNLRRHIAEEQAE